MLNFGFDIKTKSIRPSVYIYFYGCPEARKVFRARFDTGFKTGELFLVAVQFFPDTNFWTYTKTDTVFVTQLFQTLPKLLPFAVTRYFKGGFDWYLYQYRVVTQIFQLLPNQYRFRDPSFSTNTKTDAVWGDPKTVIPVLVANPKKVKR